MRRLCHLVALLLAAPSIAAPDSAKAEPASLVTEFALLVGFPSGERAATGGVVLVPGTVVPLDSTPAVADGHQLQGAVERSLSFTRAVDKLWSTFRLDPGRLVQRGQTLSTSVDRPVDLTTPPGSSVSISATLLGFNDSIATYRVRFRQGESVIADSKLSVNRGGRAVVGGMDGDAAPYIFLFVQPDPPHGEAVRYRKELGMVQPEAIHRGEMPVYPQEARQAESSWVPSSSTWSSTSMAKVVDAGILESPATSLGDAAIEAVRQWRFEPARDAAGEPIKVRFVLTIRFALE